MRAKQGMVWKKTTSKHWFRVGKIIAKLGQFRRLLYAQGECSFMLKVNRKKAHKNTEFGLKKWPLNTGFGLEKAVTSEKLVLQVTQERNVLCNRLVSMSAKFGICTIVGLNESLVEAKLCTQCVPSSYFSFSKCPI